MVKENLNRWRLNRVVNLSVLVQLVFLGSLIIGSWVNLQRQLDLLGHDVRQLVESNKEFHQKIESLWTEAIEREYRLRNVEKAVAKGSGTQ
jgi:hypothetical protein